MKCDNCRAYNAHVIIINEGEEKQLLCPRCLKILKLLDQDYENIVSHPTSKSDTPKTVPQIGS